MRSSKKRSRSNQNRPRSLGNIVNRVFDSSGPEGKVRGTPQQIIEKYNALARDAQLSNDRVAAENFLQHAEHYTRMLAEAQRELAAEQEARQQVYQQQQNIGRERDQRERAEPRPAAGPREPAPAGGMPEAIDFGPAEVAGLVDLPEAGVLAGLPGEPPTAGGGMAGSGAAGGHGQRPAGPRQSPAAPAAKRPSQDAGGIPGSATAEHRSTGGEADGGLPSHAPAASAAADAAPHRRRDSGDEGTAASPAPVQPQGRASAAAAAPEGGTGEAVPAEGAGSGKPRRTTASPRAPRKPRAPASTTPPATDEAPGQPA